MTTTLITIPGGGHVHLIGVLGSDLSVVNAARVSFDKQSVEFSDRDARLIRYLAANSHWTPFAQPQIQMRLRMPLFVARQWFKHQIGFTRNEVSRRYVDSGPEFYLPTVWRARAEDKKQGSAGPVEAEAQERFDRAAHDFYEEARRLYNHLLAAGCCPEQARMVLPQAMFTEFVETGSLFAYARLIRLRDHEHAQAETREYAVAVRELLTPRFPVSMAALLPVRAGE